MNWPRITIVTPTFERVEYLEECICSVLDQGYPNLEYIICDGGSKNPELLALLRKYETHLAWWDSMPDRGHAEAIRRGFDRSTGEIIAWMCSDDYYLSGALLAIGRVFRDRPATEVVYGHSQLVDAHGIVLKENRAIPYLEWAAFTTANIHQPATFWTRAVYERVGGCVGGKNWENVVFEPNVDLLCRFQRGKAKFFRIKTVLSAMRMHDSTVGSRYAKKMSEVSTNTFRHYYPVISKPRIYASVHLLMRFYQIVALCLQGDAQYLLGEIRRRFRRNGNRKGLQKARIWL